MGWSELDAATTPVALRWAAGPRLRRTCRAATTSVTSGATSSSGAPAMTLDGGEQLTFGSGAKGTCPPTGAPSSSSIGDVGQTRLAFMDRGRLTVREVAPTERLKQVYTPRFCPDGTLRRLPEQGQEAQGLPGGCSISETSPLKLLAGLQWPRWTGP